MQARRVGNLRPVRRIEWPVVHLPAGGQPLRLSPAASNCPDIVRIAESNRRLAQGRVTQKKRSGFRSQNFGCFSADRCQNQSCNQSDATGQEHRVSDFLGWKQESMEL